MKTPRDGGANTKLSRWGLVKPCMQWNGEFPGLCVNDLISNSIAHDFADRMAIEFSHNVGAVRFRRFDAQAQRHRNLLAAFSFCQQLHDFALPRRQAVARWVTFGRTWIAFE